MYGRYDSGSGGSDARRQITRFFNKDGIPATLAILLINVLTFFLIYGLPNIPFANWLIFDTRTWLHHPWTLLTWPLVTLDHPLNFIFACGWFWTFSGSLERSWGTQRYVGFLVGTTVLTAFTYWVGSLFLGPGFLAGLWIVSGPAAVAWVAVNRWAQMSLFFIPLPAPVIAILAAVMVWFDAGAAIRNPLLGLFALSGCAAAWWYSTQGREFFGSGSAFDRFRTDQRTPRTPPNARFRDFDRERIDRNTTDVLGRLREQQERRKRDKQLEEMFRRSGLDDSDEDKSGGGDRGRRR